MSANLCWRGHYQCLLAKAYKILGLLRRIFSNVFCIRAKKILSLPVSCEISIDILFSCLEASPHKGYYIIPRRATKFILNDFSSNYKLRLVSLGILPLMMQLEINDIMFCIKSLLVLSISTTSSNSVQVGQVLRNIIK